MSKITRILSVDLGNYNTKTSSKVLFESRFKKVNVDEEVFGSDYLILDEKKYLIEMGTWDLNFDKANKDYLPCLLTAICKSFKNLNNITGLGVVLGLPLTQLKNKENLINKLEGKKFEFNYNGKDKIVQFEKVAVLGEGFSSIYTLTESERCDEDILLVDIGGRTVNVVEYSDGIVENTGTIVRGMYNIYEDIQSKILGSAAVRIEKVRSLVESSKVDQEKVDEVKYNFVEDLANDLKVYNPQFKSLYFTGGGSLTLKKQLKNKFGEDIHFLNDLLFSNCLGNKLVAETNWGE